MRPGLWECSLRDMEKNRLPELNTKYQEQEWKKLRKAIHEPRERSGPAKLLPPKHILRMQENYAQKNNLFVTEYDSLQKKEEPEVVLDEEGKPKKKKKKKEEEEKFRLNHKYNVPISTKANKKRAQGKEFDDIFENSSNVITLSLFHQPNITVQTSDQFQNDLEKQKAKDLVAEKKARLLALIAPPKSIQFQLEAEAAAKAEAEKETKSPKKVEAIVETPEAPPEELPEVIESEEEQLFDENYHLEEEVKEYNNIEKIFKQHNIPYDEEKLKSAIIWNNKVHPEQEKKVDYTQGRYPEGLS